MPGSARFRIGVHVVTLLAHERGRALTSSFVAGSVNANPVVIRRILGLLSRAGLVSTTEGARGGSRLARPAAQITLADVYGAVETDGLFGEARNRPNPHCAVGRSVQTVLAARIRRLEEALRGAMSEVTVADLLTAVRKADS